MPVVPISPNIDVANRKMQASYASLPGGSGVPGMAPGEAQAGSVPNPQFALMAAAILRKSGRLQTKGN